MNWETLKIYIKTCLKLLTNTKNNRRQMSGKLHTRCRHGIPSTWKSLSGSTNSLCSKSKIIFHLLCLLMFILQCSIVYCEEVDGKALLKKGKEELDGKKYEEAIKNLSEAENKFPLLGDYALLWLSEAYT